MKIWKKINKGLILTIIVLLALIIYLNGVEKQRNADKKDIEKACENFIALTDKYLVLPEEMQELTGTELENKEEEYSKEMKNKLEKIMISNEEAVKMQYIALVKALESGYNTIDRRTNFERKIIKISSYEFDGNQVTVDFTSNVKNTTKNIVLENQEENNDSFNTYNDEIILKKIDGQWKVVYSSLQYEINSGITYVDDSMGMY